MSSFFDDMEEEIKNHDLLHDIALQSDETDTNIAKSHTSKCWKCIECDMINNLSLTISKYNMKCCLPLCSNIYDSGTNSIILSTQWNTCCHGQYLENVPCDQCQHQNNYHDEQCPNDIAECISCLHLKTALNQYHKINKQKDNISQSQLFENVNMLINDQLFNGTYSTLQLLNDFDHVKYNHSVHNNPAQFALFHEYITDDLSFCNVQTCKTAQEYYKKTRVELILHQQDDNVNTMSPYCTQLLSRIHSYFLHSQQTNRLTMHEIKIIEEKLKQCEQNNADNDETKLQLISGVMEQKNTKLLEMKYPPKEEEDKYLLEENKYDHVNYIPDDEGQKHFSYQKSDESYFKPYEQSNKPQMQFSDIIPYRSTAWGSVLVSDLEETTRAYYSFWQNTNAKNCEDQLALSVCFGVISVFSTITQLLFVIYGPEPYKWISLAFLLIAQLTCLGICGWIYLVKLQDRMHERIVIVMMCCGVGCLLAALSPITLPVMLKIYEDKHTDQWIPFIMKSSPSLAIAVMQAYPQVIMLTVMIAGDGYKLNTNSSEILIWSFLASSLCIITLSVQIASIFKHRYLFLLNSIWLLFDCLLTLVIVFAIFYNPITLGIFYVDIALYGVLLIMSTIILLILLIQKVIHVSKCDAHCWLTVLLCIGGGPFVIVPMLIYFNLFTFVSFCVMDQLYGWNICLMNLGDINAHNEAWCRHVLVEWITNGKNTEERNDRLYSINMVILDNDLRLKKKYVRLFDDMVANIGSSVRSTQYSAHQMIATFNIFFESTFEMNALVVLNKKLGDLSFILKWAIVYFPINRALHLIIPFVVIMYIVFAVKWNIAKLDPFLQVLFILLVILSVICGIGVVITWRSLNSNYLRWILPINLRRTGMNMDWDQFSSRVANCHYYITVLKVLEEFSGGGGDKYIIYLIFDFVGMKIVNTEISSVQAKYMIKKKASMFFNEHQHIKLLLLSTGMSGTSTLFKALKIITKDQNMETETIEARHVIRQNCVAGILTLLKKSQELNDQDPQTNHACLVNMNDEIVAAIQMVIKYGSESFSEVLDYDELHELGRALCRLWNLDAVRATYDRRGNAYCFPDNMDYFFNKVRQIMMQTYTPTMEDSLKCRVRTTGMIEYIYDIRDNEFILMDVGGMRNERKKWIWNFGDTAAVIFVASLTHYHRVMFENESKRALHESIELFAEICNSTLFLKSEIILILNKDDLFREELKLQIPLSVCFSHAVGWNGKQWKGPNYSPIIGDATADKEHFDECYEAAIKFIQERFIEVNQFPNRVIFRHIVCATDIDTVEKVFWDIQNIVIRSNLRRGEYQIT